MINGFYEMTREDKVNEFRKAAGKLNYKQAPDEADMIFECILEEFGELTDASLDYDDDPSPQHRAALVKEWADLQYVVSQAALYYEIPAEAAFNRVHNNNMTKVIDGEVKFREDGKILKPDNYVAPDMGGL